MPEPPLRQSTNGLAVDGEERETTKPADACGEFRAAAALAPGPVPPGRLPD